MPWFAWAYIIAMAACCAVIAYCAFDLHRIVRRRRG